MTPPSLMPPEEPPEPKRAGLVHLVVIVLLVLGGLYLAHVLRDASQLQDCIMSGRTNCAPIDAPESSSP